MNQKPYFCLEAGSRISWSELERYLPNDVVEIPWKREFDSVATHRRDVGPLVPYRYTARFGRFRLWLRNRFRFGCTRLRDGFRLRFRRSHTRRRLWRGLGRRQRQFL